MVNEVNEVDNDHHQEKDINNNVFKSFADEVSKLSKDQLVRGEAIHDIEQQCLNLCQTYIGGQWLKATDPMKDIIVKRISGGFTNQLYHIHLNVDVEQKQKINKPEIDDDNEVMDVAIKLYQEKHIKNYDKESSERLNDTIILTIMSHTGLGPKVYGIFNNGFIQKFYKVSLLISYHKNLRISKIFKDLIFFLSTFYFKHEQFRDKHQQNPKLLNDLARLAARINNLNVPINKTNNLLFQEMKNMLKTAYKINQIEQLSVELNCKTLQKRDVRLELQEQIDRITQMNIPIVFCHNDFRGNNILVTEPHSKILACDLEYCGYGSRGFDLASFLMEWGKKDLFHQVHQLPNDDVISTFAGLYITECDKLVTGYSQQSVNSLEAHVREVKLMTLMNFLFFISIIAKQTESIVSSLEFDLKKNIMFVENVYEEYFNLKQKLINDGTIQEL